MSMTHSHSHGMKPCEILDGNGNPWQPKRFSPAKKRDTSVRQERFKGWNVYGTTQAILDREELEHRLACERARALDMPEPNKPKPHLDKLNGKPYTIEDSANTFIRMCEDAGYINIEKRKA